MNTSRGNPIDQPSPELRQRILRYFRRLFIRQQQEDLDRRAGLTNPKSEYLRMICGGGNVTDPGTDDDSRQFPGCQTA